MRSEEFWLLTQSWQKIDPLQTTNDDGRYEGAKSVPTHTPRHQLLFFSGSKAKLLKDTYSFTNLL